MITTTTEPITTEWSTPAVWATARQVSSRLARMAVADLGPDLTPFLAAAGAELASVTGIEWRFGTGDPAVALLRLIAKATLRDPDAAGPHTSRLLAMLP